MTYLFCEPEPPFDTAILREKARETVSAMALITDCASGNRAAYRALLTGFWPYVEGFEIAIGRRMMRMLQRKRLNACYGEEFTSRFIAAAIDALYQMQKEEGDHADLWQKDAEDNGFALTKIGAPDSVMLLLDCAYTNDPVEFFSHLAATEFVAVELTKELYRSKWFIAAFHPSGVWNWGDCHLEHDEESISHLAMDLDLARGLHRATRGGCRISDADVEISDLIVDRFGMFLQAARDVHQSVV